MNFTLNTRRCFLMWLLAFIICSGPMHHAHAQNMPPETDSEIGVVSGLTTLVYFPVKLAIVAVGGAVAAVGYVISGFDADFANQIWTPSATGTYVITPKHLKGELPIEFFGPMPDSAQ